jgi:nitronate monooxygenase
VAIVSDLGMSIPLFGAPMAGGPSTPALVQAASAAGGLGFLAGGYKSVDQLAGQIAEVRPTVPSFGVNLFVPNPVPVDRDAFIRFASVVRAEADRYGIDVPDGDPIEDDDAWDEKIALLLDEPVPVVSFTFNVPSGEVVAALRKAGSIVVQTVTSVDEAKVAAEHGVDVLAVQASAAGGHSGTWTPSEVPPATRIADLLRAIASVVDLPLVAAGGISTAAEVAAVLHDGAVAAMVGTAVLRSPESGAAPAFKDALVDPARGGTVVTRAFTGRPARALRNAFVTAYDRESVAGYPAIHHLTSPMRRASTAAGDPERMNLWAGVGHQTATTDSATTILRNLAAG